MRPPGTVSPTGEIIQGVGIPLLATSRGPNAIVLAYAARAVVILGRSKCDNKLCGQ